jgi:hypothetical protein
MMTAITRTHVRASADRFDRVAKKIFAGGAIPGLDLPLRFRKML